MDALLPQRTGKLSVAWLLLSIACAAGAQNAPLKVINVYNVRQLYAAVNDPGNQGVTLKLAPRTYVLSSAYQNGNPRPNQGSLRMPPGMSLVGAEKRVDKNKDGVPDPVSNAAPDDFTVAGTDTIIDGSGLVLPPEVRTDCEGNEFAAPNGVIQVGVHNTVSHLTISSGNNLAISEPTIPVDPHGNMSMRVTYTVLDSTLGSMTFANCQCASRHAHSTLQFSHNIVRNGVFLGLLIQNFLTGDANNTHADGPAIWAMITSNLFYNTGKGLQVTGGEWGTDGGSVTLYMSGNVFRNNGANFKGQAGVSRGAPTRAIANRLTLRSEDDTFGESPANLTLIAGPGEDADDPKNGELEAEFLQSHFVRDSADTPPEFSIIGGGGIRNRARVLISGASVRTSAGVRTRGDLFIQNQITPGIGTSTAKLFGSRAEFLQNNQGLPAPPARFFLEN